MRPIQIWLPQTTATTGQSMVQRDRDRAFGAWKHHSTVWLLTDLKERIEWRESPFDRVVAIPAETLERIDVYHADGNGYVWGPGAQGIFPDARLAGVLDACLNLKSLGGVEFCLTPRSMNATIPRIKDGVIEYQQRDIPIEPVACLLFDATCFPRVNMQWPPKGWSITSVSPEAESEKLFGPMRWGEEGGECFGISSQHSDVRTLPIMLKWPEPLTNLMPWGSGVDEMYGAATIRHIAERSVEDLEAALREAKTSAESYLSEGVALAANAEFFPLLMARGEEAALGHFLMRYDLDEVETAADAFNHEQWRKILFQEVPIRRAWGPLGLLWTLMIDALEDQRQFKSCERCGRLNSGRKTRRFCHREDNESCFKARMAQGQRESRRRRQTPEDG